MNGADMAKLSDGKTGSIAKATAPAKGQRFIFDDHRDAPRGFGLRITAAGGKAFVLSYNADGKQRRATIGDWPTWTLEAARAEATAMRRNIDTGTDPLDEKQKRRERKNEPTVKDVAMDWLDKHASGLKSQGTIRGLIVNDLLPAIGDSNIKDVRRRNIIDLVEAKAKTAPRSAAQLLIYARAVFTYAADREYIEVSPVADLKPASIKLQGQRDPLKAVKRTRVLDADEIKSFWDCAEDSSLHRLTVLVLKLVLVTGQRPGEVAGMHDSEIDGNVWTIPAARRGKTDTEHAIWLTDTALKIIAAAKLVRPASQGRRQAPPSGHVFEIAQGKPISVGALSQGVRKAYAGLGGKDTLAEWRPHDLRRTCRTGLSACRVRPDIAELVIGHVKPGILGTYDHHAFDDERRRALEAWESRLTAIVEGRDPDSASGDNVVQMVEARA